MPVDPARLKDIFVHALARTNPADRAAYLDAKCAGDVTLRTRVEALLRASEDPDSLLDTAAPAPLPDDPATRSFEPAGDAVDRPDAPTVSVGDRVGPYKLLERIGEGGMGDVWVADQLEPIKRRVAVKLIKAGMDSRSVLARFEAERQALAVMAHPNIAKVLDAGTTPDGRPYFVMELVKGVPITEFADARKLTAKQRLELFVSVCQAIQHAHMKGVIHRDIKPGNVLVELHDDRAVVKVIDFGVAKAVGQQLTEKTVYTGFGALVGTPAYMAPEQATFNAVDVDTRADVYALGVLLYELLAGSPPIEKERLKKAALDEVLRIVRDEEPPRPSQRLSTSEARAGIAATRQTEPARLSALMKGELDWIVMKALEKDRTRRYETANGFAADVLRYLSGEPVQAVPPSLRYRLAKAYRRNKAAVLTVGVVSLALLTATAVSFAFGVLAKQAEQVALTNQAKAVTAQEQADAERDRANAEAEKVMASKERQQADQYLWDMQLLPLAFDKGTAAEVNKLLERHAPKPGEADRRCFEWHYWNRQQNPQVVTTRFGTAEPDLRSTWCVSDDSRRVARLDPPTGADGLPTLTVWDRATRAACFSYRIPSRPPEGGNSTSPVGLAPQFSPDGQRVVVEWHYALRDATPPGNVVGRGGPNRLRIVNHVRQVMDVDTGKVLFEPPGTGRFSRTQFSSDGRRFASVSAGAGGWGGAAQSTALTVWDVESGKLITPEKPAQYSQAVLHPDGETFLTTDLARNPDPASAAGGAGMQVPVVRLARRDVTTGTERWGRLVPCGCLNQLAISPDGRLVAATLADGSEQRSRARAVGIWDAATGEQLQAWPLPAGVATPFVLGLAFSPRGTRLAVSWSVAQPNGREAGPSGGPSEFTLLDTKTSQPLPTLTGLGGFGSSIELAYSPDEKQVARTGGPTIDVWDTHTGGRPLVSFRTPVNPLQVCRFTPDGQRLWTLETDGAYKEWELRLPRPVVVEFEGGNAVQTADFAASGNGERFAHLFHTTDEKSGAAEFPVRVRDSAGKSLALIIPPPRAAGTGTNYRRGLAFDHTGKRVLLSRSEGRGVGVGQVMPKDWRAGLTPPDLTVWDTDTSERLFHRSLDDDLTPSGVYIGHLTVLSRDGRMVAAAVEPGKAGQPVRVRRFDVDTGREWPVYTLAGATTLAALAVSPDGKRVAAVAVTHDTANRRLSLQLVVWGEGGGEPAATTDLVRDATAPASFGFRAFTRSGAAWTPDGSRLVVSYLFSMEAGFAVHDADTGERLVVLERPPSPQGVPVAAIQAVCSPDGQRVAAFLERNTLETPELKVWDVVSGKEVLTLRKAKGFRGFGGPFQSAGRQLVFSPDGHKLMAWEFDQMPEWSPERGDYRADAYVRSVWDATSPPEAKK
jgi:serine/threonine protein kinase/WD40 repeat protein